MTRQDDRTSATHSLFFAPFRLDLATEQLWRGAQQLAVRPKTFAVLRYLVEHPSRLVTRDELRQAVWPETVGSERAPKQCIRELRQVLSEETATPRFIETIVRRGWRFIAPLSTTPLSQKSQVKSHKSFPTPNTQPPAPTVVGHDTELTQLHAWLGIAQSGERQIIFVTGEPGIGKTCLVESFLAEVGAARRGRPLPGQPQGVAPTQDPWITQGQCIEQHGAGEAFLPVLDALGRLARGAGGTQLIELLRTYAPMWLMQLPAFIDGEEVETLQHKVQGASRERMLRELAEMLEVLTLHHSLILVLEDLHWSDVSTLDLLAFIARRKEPVRLLVIGTYRPVEMLNDGHPLQSITQELYAHRLAMELPLGVLSEADIATYLEQRLSGGAQGTLPLHPLARLLHHRTGGNPLFLVATVDELVAQGKLTQTDNSWTLQGEVADVGIVESIRHLVARQRGRLSADERQTLEAASVAGMEFSAAAVAAALTTETMGIERQCEQLAMRQHFLRRVGVDAWPDGTLAGRYSFLHAVYQQLWHERVTPTQLRQHHLQIGQRKERAYGDRTREIAAELALHFEQGRDYRRAIQYLQQAAETALQRSAHQETITHLTKGLELLKLLPDTPERIHRELRLLRSLGPALVSLKGFTAQEVEHTYARASALCQWSENPHQLIYMLQGIQIFHLVRGEVRKARDLAEQGLRVARRIATPTALMTGHAFLMEPLYYLGELTAAREHLEQAWAHYDPQEHNLDVIQHWAEPGVALLWYLALTSLSLGYPDQAQQQLAEGLALAERLDHPFSLATILLYACGFDFTRQEWQQARERAEEAMRLSTEHGFPDRLAHGIVLRGQALVGLGQVDEGLAQMQQGLAFFGATGAELARVGHLPSLASAYARVGRIEEGLAVLAESLEVVDRTELRVHEAGLYRLKGMLTLQSQASLRQVKASQNTFEFTNPEPPIPNPQAEAEVCFLKAIDIARKQSTKSWELRATTSLARLWQQQGKTNEAHRMLSKVYGWFTEGFDTKDLQEAKALLEELGA